MPPNVSCSTIVHRPDLPLYDNAAKVGKPPNKTRFLQVDCCAVRQQGPRRSHVYHTVRSCLLLMCSFSALSHSLPSQQRWTVAAQPTLEIPATSSNGDVQFEHAVSATRLRSGEIIVADGAAGMLRVFDGIGRPSRTVGRRGSGPGEFQYIGWMGPCGGDSIVVWDFMQRRLTFLDASVRLGRQTPSVAGVNPFTIACSASAGVIAAHAWSSPPRPDGPVFRSRAPLVLLDRSATVTRTIDTVASGEMAIIGGGAGPRPLGKYTHLAMSRAALYVATGDSAKILVFAPNGASLGAIGTDVVRTAPTAPQINRAVESAVAFGSKAIRDRLRPAMRALAPPAQLPPFSGILVDARDVLWVVLTFPGEGTTRLRALSTRGSTLAEVRVPADLTVFEIGRNYILGLHETADGEQFVRQYELRRR